MSKREQRGGWPKRDLRAIVVRLPPGVLSLLAQRASAEGKSRSRLIEETLTAAAALKK